MIQPKAILALVTLVITLQISACGQATPPAPDSPSPAQTSPNTSEVVEFEPAYPEDVSTETLSQEDMDQQPSSLPHSHGDGEHSHDPGDEHDHEH